MKENKDRPSLGRRGAFRRECTDLGVSKVKVLGVPDFERFGTTWYRRSAPDGRVPW
jgi:hypothetical protein